NDPLMLYQGSYIPVSADLKTKSTTTMFIIGSIFWTLGNVLHVIGLTYAPTSLLGPVNSLGLIITMWLSWQLLGEELNRHLVISSCFTILGIIICLIASLKESQTDLYVTLESWHDSIYLYFGLFLVLTLIVIGATILTSTLHTL
ncbi:magnesium transporter, partial [Gregarina niphandrodes]